MGSRLKTYRDTKISELAEAISSFNINQVADLLSDDGKYAIQNGKCEIVISGKIEFISWLTGCYNKYPNAGSGKKLGFRIIQSMHSMTGKQIIVFEDGRFPVFSDNQHKNEQSGLVIGAGEDKIDAIGLCLLVKKTENPYIYEKRSLGPA